MAPAAKAATVSSTITRKGFETGAGASSSSSAAPRVQKNGKYPGAFKLGKLKGSNSCVRGGKGSGGAGNSISTSSDGGIGGSSLISGLGLGNNSISNSNLNSNPDFNIMNKSELGVLFGSGAGSKLGSLSSVQKYESDASSDSSCSSGDESEKGDDEDSEEILLSAVDDKKDEKRANQWLSNYKSVASSLSGKLAQDTEGKAILEQMSHATNCPMGVNYRVCPTRFIGGGVIADKISKSLPSTIPWCNEAEVAEDDGKIRELLRKGSKFAFSTISQYLRSPAHMLRGASYAEVMAVPAESLNVLQQLSLDRKRASAEVQACVSNLDNLKTRFSSLNKIHDYRYGVKNESVEALPGRVREVVRLWDTLRGVWRFDHSEKGGGADINKTNLNKDVTGWKFGKNN